MTTHADLLAAVEKARPSPHLLTGTGWRADYCDARDAHCDDLAALLALHKPWRGDGNELLWCEEMDVKGGGCGEPWPCPTTDIVIRRLRAWGML